MLVAVYSESCKFILQPFLFCYIYYIWFTISSCYCSIPLTLVLIGRHGGLSTLCHICKFACQQKVLKTFPGPGYLRSEDEIVWLWHLFVNLYIWLTSSSCYGSILLTFVLIKRDGGLSTLRHSCEFACQQDRVLKTFSFLEDIRKKIWKKTLAAIPMLLFCF